MGNDNTYDNFIFVKNYIKNIIDNNSKEIKNNSKEINDILKIEDIQTREEYLTSKLNSNKELLAYNNKLLVLYNYISDFITTRISNNLISNIDYFDLTVKGNIDYNEKHPLFNDNKFFKKLLEYHKSKENYDYCHYLKNIKNV